MSDRRPERQDTTNYLSIGGNGTETITFASEKNTFGLYWGSLDSYNSIKFYDGTTLVASYTGADISPLFPTGNQGSFASNGYVEFSGLHSFNKVVLAQQLERIRDRQHFRRIHSAGPGFQGRSRVRSASMMPTSATH